MAEREEAEKTKAKKKAIEFTEALKLEMARKVESEEELIKLQKEESERQWAKRYAAWEKEELARRALMEEVYHDREEQAKERDMVESEIKRLEAIEQERVEGEGLVQK